MTQFPSSIISFSTKANGQLIDASDVNIPQAEITALETKVGVDGSSDTSSLDYLIKSSVSSGGGHIQSANKGGTGQTSYNKGDLLVGASTSVVSKLAVGADGTSPIADSTQATGISWGLVSAALPYAQDSGTGSVYAISPVPCILSYTPGQIYVAKITATNTVVSPAISISSLVAKKIINIDRTSVLVGQIPSSSLSLFGYDGSSSVMQLLNPFGITTYKNGATTADGSSTQTIAHGLGKTPKYVRLNSQSADGWSQGNYNGTTNSCVFKLTGNNQGSTSSYAINVGGSGNQGVFSTGVITFDATNITITWTQTSGGGTGNLNWEVYA